MRSGSCGGWLFTLLVGAAGCNGQANLGPPESHLILGPATPAATSPSGFPVVSRLDIKQQPAMELARLTADGFAAEMVRSVYLAKQLVRSADLDGKRYGEAVRAQAALPLGVVIGLDAGAARGRGLSFTRWLREPEEQEHLAWIGLPATIADDRALIQTLSGRLAAHAASFVTDDDPKSAVLVDAFRIAMEVISREWRQGRGPVSSLPTTAGTMKQRMLFADIRENHAVMKGEQGGELGELRPAAELLSDPRVVATVLYRLAQTRVVGNRVGPAEIYRPFFEGALPEGVSGAQVLGPIRNYVAKLFTAWARAILVGRPPLDGADLLNAYADLFPEERREVLRIFLVTTYAATVKPGGISRRPQDSTAAVAEVAALTEELLQGKRTLKDAVVRAPRAKP